MADRRSAGAIPRRATRPSRLRRVGRGLFRGGSQLIRWMLRRLWRAPVAVRVAAAAALIVGAWALTNWGYQVLRKPSELFFPVSGSLAKRPPDTWREYAPLFREHATPTITPEFLAALAQVEGAGNPIARTYWQWRPSWRPFEWYRPASSAVGMYQMTDATFQDAKRYCIHHHAVAEADGWSSLRGCWFNGLYTRVLPGHAIEMTAALLDHDVTALLAESQVRRATLRQEQDLAAVAHLCGVGWARVFIHRGFNASGLRCGDQSVAHYLAQVNGARRQFVMLAGGPPSAHRAN
jgi:hypothetical protein